MPDFPLAVPTINAGLVDGVDAGDDTPGSLNVGPHAAHHNKLAVEVVAIASGLLTGMAADIKTDNSHGVVIGDVRLSRSAAKTLNVDGLVKATGGLATITKAGVIADSDITSTGVAAAVDGLLGVDTSSNTLMFRSGGTWRTAAGGAAAGPSDVFKFASGTSAGATTVTLDRLPVITAQLGYVVFDPYTIECEIRKVNSIAGAVLTLNGALTYAHSSDDLVFFLAQGSVPLAWFGAKADGSNEEPVIQRALDETTSSAGNLWVEGQNKTYSISLPIIGGRSAKLRHTNLKAKVSGPAYGPVDATNAMILGAQGNIRSFTAAAATDIITATNHGIPGDDVGVVFKGASLPAPLVAGRIYWARDRLTNSFKVAATRGGAAIDLTSDGSGTAYCECPSLCKMWLDDVFVDAQGITGLNCVQLSLQQPSQINKLRCDNATSGYGLGIGGQQATFYNFETINCLHGLVLGEQAALVGGCSFMWFYGFNAEQCDRGILIGPGGAENCGVWGGHFEMNNGSGLSTTTSVAVDLAYGCNSLTLDNISVSMQSTGQTFMKVATGITTSYQLRHIRWSGGTSSTGQIFVTDPDRGLNLDQWDDCRGKILSLEAAAAPSSQSYPDPGPIRIAGMNGRLISMGSTINSQPSIHTKPGTSQTGDQYQAEDTSGNRVSGFSKGGYIHTLLNAAPADGDVTTGQVMFWFDKTNGAAALMVKGKQADGTVKTGSVSMAGGSTDLTPAVILAPGASSRNVIQPSGDFIPLTLKGNASQTTDLLQFVNSSATLLSSVDSAGRFLAPLGSVTNAGYGFKGDPDTGIFSPAADRVAMVGGGTERWTLGQFGRFSINTDQINSAQTLVWTQTAGFLSFVPASGSYVELAGWMRTYVNQTRFGSVGDSGADGAFNISGVTAGQVGMRIKAAASQTADLIQINNNTPAILGRFNKDGYFMTRKIAAPADGDLANSELAVWLDDTVGATKAMFKAKDSGGTVRTAAVALT